MTGYRTYIFAILTGVFAFLRAIGVIQEQEAKDILDALTALSGTLTVVFLRSGIKGEIVSIIAGVVEHLQASSEEPKKDAKTDGK